MNEHERALALAATDIDFPLSPPDAAELGRHLTTCDACALTVMRLRDDASALAAPERLPAPPHVRQAVVTAATGGATVRSGAGMRWSFAAALLALLAVGGTFVTGAVLERVRDTGPTPTQDLVPRPTDAITPSRPVGWSDLGTVDEVFDGRTVQLVLPAPGGGLVALGRDQASTQPVVWVSDDGTTWTPTDQPDDVFGFRVPTGGALFDDTLWVVGWEIATQGAQRAIWASSDGATWSRAGASDGLLGTEASALELTAGPAGILVWAGDGRAWTSTDGDAWVRSDAGVAGVTDAAVDGAGFHLVGRDDSHASFVDSVDGRTWSQPSRQVAGTDERVGIERAGDETLLAWVGDQAYRMAADGWHRDSGAPAMPSGSVVGGPPGYAVVASPTADGVQRGWIGDGEHWTDRRSDATSSGARNVVAIAPFADGWYVLTRQGTTYRAWLLS